MWAQVINSILGIWLMAAPGIFGFGGPPADNDHIFGPLVATFAIVALWECTNSVRKFNIPIAIWLILAPMILSYPASLNFLIDSTTGVLILIFSLVGVKKKERYGGGWSSLWRKSS